MRKPNLNNSEVPTYPNPHPSGVTVEWVFGRGWIQIRKSGKGPPKLVAVEAAELRKARAGGRKQERAEILAEVERRINELQRLTPHLTVNLELLAEWLKGKKP